MASNNICLAAIKRKVIGVKNGRNILPGECNFEMPV